MESRGKQGRISAPSGGGRYVIDGPSEHDPVLVWTSLILHRHPQKFQVPDGLGPFYRKRAHQAFQLAMVP